AGAVGAGRIEGRGATGWVCRADAGDAGIARGVQPAARHASLVRAHRRGIRVPAARRVARADLRDARIAAGCERLSLRADVVGAAARRGVATGRVGRADVAHAGVARRLEDGAGHTLGVGAATARGQSADVVELAVVRCATRLFDAIADEPGWDTGDV